MSYHSCSGVCAVGVEVVVVVVVVAAAAVVELVVLEPAGVVVVEPAKAVPAVVELPCWGLANLAPGLRRIIFPPGLSRLSPRPLIGVAVGGREADVGSGVVGAVVGVEDVGSAEGCGDRGGARVLFSVNFLVLGVRVTTGSAGTDIGAGMGTTGVGLVTGVASGGIIVAAISVVATGCVVVTEGGAASARGVGVVFSKFSCVSSNMSIVSSSTLAPVSSNESWVESSNSGGGGSTNDDRKSSV